ARPVDVGPDAHLLELAHVSHGPLDLYRGFVGPDDGVVACREIHLHASFGRERTLQGVRGTTGPLGRPHGKRRTHTEQSGSGQDWNSHCTPPSTALRRKRPRSLTTHPRQGFQKLRSGGGRVP